MKQQSKTKKIRKGDKVLVRAGNDRGQTGTILAIQGRRALVQGINVRKKTVRPTEQNPKGNIIDRECFMDTSNLMLCTQDDKPIKVRIKEDKKGKRSLVYKVDGKEMTHRVLQEDKRG